MALCCVARVTRSLTAGRRAVVQAPSKHEVPPADTGHSGVGLGDLAGYGGQPARKGMVVAVRRSQHFMKVIKADEGI